MELQNSDEDVNEIPWNVTWDFLLQSIAAFLKEFAIFFKKNCSLNISRVQNKYQRLQSSESNLIDNEDLLTNLQHSLQCSKK